MQTKGAKQTASIEVVMINDDPKPKQVGESSIFAKLGEIVLKEIDCCRE